MNVLLGDTEKAFLMLEFKDNADKKSFLSLFMTMVNTHFLDSILTYLEL